LTERAGAVRVGAHRAMLAADAGYDARFDFWYDFCDRPCHAPYESD
jgi:hypothetical protein